MASHAGGEAYGLISLVVSFAMEVLEELETNVIHTAGIPTLLAHPEYQSLERAEPLMNFLSEMGEGVNLPVVQGENVKILIGPENVADELKESSVIMASYDIGGGMQGVIGVVGPTRMTMRTWRPGCPTLRKVFPACLAKARFRPPPGANLKNEEDTTSHEQEK